MTDPLSLRAMAVQISLLRFRMSQHGVAWCSDVEELIQKYEAAQSSWANEKAEMARQLDEAVAALRIAVPYTVRRNLIPDDKLRTVRAVLERHASLPLAAKGE